METNCVISEVMANFLDAKRRADVDLSLVDSRVLVGATSQVRVAQQEQAQLCDQIKDLVWLDSAAIIPQGPGANQEAFAAIAEDEGAAITVRAQEVYEEIARMVDPFLGPGRSFVSNTAQAVHAAMAQVCSKLNVSSYVMPAVHNGLGSIYPTVQDLQAELKRLIRAANGDDLAVLYTAATVFVKVMASEYDQNTIPVVVLGATEEEAQGDFAAKLFGGHSISVTVTDPPEKNDVIIAFKKLKPMFARVSAVIKQKKAE